MGLKHTLTHSSFNKYIQSSTKYILNSHTQPTIMHSLQDVIELVLLRNSRKKKLYLEKTLKKNKI